MAMQPITGSSQISGVTYNADTKTLTIRFKRNGAVYQYLNVPQQIYDELLRAESKGRFLHQDIKPFYAYRHIGDD